ncbi:hypothetical protein AVEN_106211-1 [Araneus ventricosus]|uniref:Uncharacterized protein n=1 Tax=Araneus ventricosus TaxID=182803 RepID=A0A4Y2JMW3_ARAVE|nr:hypothetical protein AVEN_106211-1 [Araneus ventricosus]
MHPCRTNRPPIGQSLAPYLAGLLLSAECNAFDPIPKSRPAFSQIANSVKEHPLPPAMREFKTSQTSTVHPASSSLPHLAILFLWRWKLSLPQFNIQLRLLVNPSSPHEFRTALVVLSGLSTKIPLLQIEFH